MSTRLATTTPTAITILVISSLPVSSLLALLVLDTTANWSGAKDDGGARESRQDFPKFLSGAPLT
jgi:hypothetical protein